MCNEVDIFKRKFFDLPSRSFGETYVEPILRKYFNDSISSNKLFDALRGDNKQRVEYKAVRVVHSNKTKKKSLYDNVMSITPISDRIGTIDDIKKGNIVANCQNIKLEDFDILDYVLVDADGFHIFEITTKDFIKYIEEGKFPNWCDKHGSKDGGKNGQFPINSGNIETHLNQWHKKTLSWKDILDIVKTI